MREEGKVVAQVVILSVEAVDFRGNFKRCSLVYLENFENSGCIEVRRK